MTPSIKSLFAAVATVAIAGTAIAQVQPESYAHLPPRGLPDRQVGRSTGATNRIRTVFCSAQYLLQS